MHSAKLPLAPGRNWLPRRPGPPTPTTRRSTGSPFQGRGAAAGRDGQLDRQRTAGFIDQCIAHLRQYKGISIDVGDTDGLKSGSEKLHEILDKYRVTCTFETYSGDHTRAVADGFQNHVLPSFAKNLCFGNGCL